MPPINIIQNGTFDAGSAQWDGTDLETNYTEGDYLGNGSSNHVAETDGDSYQTTVMEQTFNIANAQSSTLSFDTALRTGSLSNAGSEGFRVDILDAAGNVIATQTYFPTADSLSTQSLAVSFPSAGNYTLRFTELGPDDSYGAIVDNITLLVCFASGTLIETDRGARPVEALQLGDLIWTLDAGLQPIRWIVTRLVTLAEQILDAKLRPVLFEPGSLGHGLPQRRLAVSPQHRVLMGDWQAELYFGQAEVLAPAHSFINGHSIRQAEAVADVSYLHFLLDGHQIVRAEGVLTESFFPTPLSLGGVERAARLELLRLFPDMPSLLGTYTQTARPVLRCGEAGVLQAAA